ncbi:hypothetical protein PP299_07365 [Mycobacteroides abscessus]|nr:hypothetical protein [Mycobacteroides abscessus]MDM1905303.1 hypothetical protein [Mycobacteroides abscessus]MDM1910845.1 hypothetical protein [Mycobacteroides abscessus]MDM1919884.1 hypothetical protein [Mycobacteroides abscessus]
MAQEKPNWEKAPPRDWAEEQAYRVAQEVRRLRDPQTAQWLADRTKALGYPLTRTVISDLEVGRRRYVTTAELIILARALNTAPIALMYPPPYRAAIQILPVPEGQEAVKLETIVAAQWFSGEPTPVLDLPDESAQAVLTLDALGLSMVDQMNYDSHLLALTRARKASELAARKWDLIARLRVRRNAKRQGLDEVSDDELDALVTEIEELRGRIAELWQLGGRDLSAETYEEMFGDGR